MRTSDFDYSLPPELIAQHPTERREGARMLVLNRANGAMEHRLFRDIGNYVRAGDVLVVNNTKVIPARVYGRKAGTGGRVELLLLEETEPGVWEVLLRSRRRPAVGSELILGDGVAMAEMLAEGEMGRARVRVRSVRPWLEILDEIGLPPLPPYIGRKAQNRDQIARDREQYQTVYAKEPGAVAAPTAGMHFTADLLRDLQARGVEVAEVTLHVGLGTFRPVEAEEVEAHRMEEERYVVPPAAAETIQHARARGGRIIAVGSTSVRTLETVAAANGGNVVASAGRSALFIYPGFQFKVVDAMITNFHLPRSTLIMMVSAFAGRDAVLGAYRAAVEAGYRFYSYGDCMLIL